MTTKVSIFLTLNHKQRSALRWFVPPVFLSIILIVTSFYNFLLFHTLAEFFPIIVAAVMYVVVWQTYSFSRNHFLMFLGCGYFWVAVLDMAHALAYKGMGIYSFGGANASVQFWIVTRFFEAILLLLAPLFLARTMARSLTFVIFGAIASVLYVAVIYGYVPTAFVEGTGLTTFKIYSEYLIIVILCAAIAHLYHRRALLNPWILRMTVLAIVMTMCAELSFTFYVSIYGLSNMAGHIFKLFSFYLIFMAIIRTTLTEPYLIMARGSSTYDAVPNPTIVVDHNGIVHQVNRAACDMLDSTEESLHNQNCHELFHPQDISVEDCLLCRHIHDGISTNGVEMQFPDSTWREFALAPIKAPGGLKGMVQVVSDITDRKRVEEALKESDETFRTLVKSTVGSVGKEFFEKIARNLNEFLRTDCVIIGEMVGDDNVDAISMVMDGKSVDNYSYRLSGTPCESATKKGFCIFQEGIQELYPDDKDLVDMGATGYTGIPLRDKKGHAIGILCALSRDTLDLPERAREVMEIIAARAEAEIERMRAEKELLDSQTSHKEAQSLAHLGHWSLDLVKNRLAWSDEVYRMFEIDKDEFEATYEAFMDAVHPEDREFVSKSYTDSVENRQGYDIEHRLLISGTEVKYVNERCKTYYAEDGTPLRSVGTVLDITERKRAEVAQRESEARQRLILDSAAEGIYGLDMDGNCTFANPACIELIGYDDTDDLVGRNMHDLIHHTHPDGTSYCIEDCHIYEGFLKGEGTHVDDEVLWRKDGTCFPVEYWSHPIEREGQIVGSVVTFIDITERKKAEAEIRLLNEGLEIKVEERTRALSAANKELESFCYAVSHDLRAPLRGIDGFSLALLEDYSDKLDAQGNNYLNRIHAATVRMGGLINDLLKLSRVTRADMQSETVNLSSIAEEVVEELKSVDTARKVTVTIAPGLTTERSDPNLLRLVLENLLGNAWKFTGKRQDAQIEFGFEVSNGKPVYHIRDNGVGFDMAYKDKLFVPFQRLHSVSEFDGTGIGLVTVQRIIQRHGGHVWAEAKVDEGATFYFTL